MARASIHQEETPSKSGSSGQMGSFLDCPKDLWQGEDVSILGVTLTSSATGVEIA